MVFFKHQYITNPTISSESHVVAAAQQLTNVLQGNMPTGNKTAEELQKVSKLFAKIAMAKNEQKPRPVAKGLCNPSGTTNNTPSMGGSTHDKGEIPIPGVTASLEAHHTQADTATQHKDQCVV
jgi:hypothetical protein